MKKKTRPINLNKIGFFKTIKYSIKETDQYVNLSNQGVRQAFAYLWMLLVIFSLIITFASLFKLYPQYKDMGAKIHILSFFQNFTIQFFLYGLLFMLEIIIISIIGFFINKMLQDGLTFKQIFSMSIYAFTNSIILFSIYTIAVCMIGVNMKYVEVFCALVALLYIMFALLKINKEKINK